MQPGQPPAKRENATGRVVDKSLTSARQSTLLQGDPNILNNMNSLIFKAVQDFIAQPGRFATE